MGPVMTLPLPVGVREGLAARRAHGSPPLDPDDLAGWLATALNLHVEETDDLPPHISAAYRSCDASVAGVRGIIVMRPGLLWPRWVLGHEAGHALTDTGTGFFLWDDGHYHVNLPA